MQITIRYEAQARRAAGVSSEKIELEDSCRVGDCLREVAREHGDPLKPMLLNDRGDIQPSLLLFKGEVQIGHADATELVDGDTLTIMTPISGG